MPPMDRFERMKKRLHILLTKGGELNETDRKFIEYLEDNLTAPVPDATASGPMLSFTPVTYEDDEPAAAE